MTSPAASREWSILQNRQSRQIRETHEEGALPIRALEPRRVHGRLPTSRGVASPSRVPGGCHDHHADQRGRRIHPVAHEVLRLGDARDRHFPHLPHPRDPAVPILDVRGAEGLDRHRAEQPVVGTVVDLSNIDGAVLHLEHDGYFASIPKELDEAALIDGAG